MARAKPKLKERADPGMGPAGDPYRSPDSLSAWDWAGPPKKFNRRRSGRVVVPRPKAAPRLIPPDHISVAAGAAWLDVVSVVWFRRIDPLLVDIQSVRHCPLSNAFPWDDGTPDFAAGVRQLCRPRPYVQSPSRLLQGDLSLSGQWKRPPKPQFKGSDTEQLAPYGFAPYREDPRPDPFPEINLYWRHEIEIRLSRPLNPSGERR